MPVLPRNDVRQYDRLVDQWWDEGGSFAALHWLAASRRSLLPRPSRDGEVLLDIGCGGGLLAAGDVPYVHVGVDLVSSALHEARAHGLRVVRGEASRIPVATGAAAVVVAGEILEHVTDLNGTVAELCRVLRPGGTVVIDTIAANRLARFATVTVAEHLPGGPPPGIHDPALFVSSGRLRAAFATHGVTLRTWGLRPSVVDYARFLRDRSRPVRMIRTRSTAVVYQGIGTKAGSW
jgi:2-polyprenyl-6-hydroxyphenyl methylase/3-demethylubiquinone-9 3-methyltransferase